MCGIFLVLSRNKVNHTNCLKTSKKLYNRGPDQQRYSFFYNKRLFLSNTVLSITGNLNKKKDIYSSKSKRFYLSFNGEIYNYKNLNREYLNNSCNNDTEVLINLHDRIEANKIPGILNGMFAYILLDKLKKKIKIVTDPQGEKNLYYYYDNNFFIVSSTPESIIYFLNLNNINLEINYEVINNYFSTRHYMPIHNTCFKKISIIENSIILDFDIKNFNFKPHKYDDPVNWISEKKYNYFQNLNEKDLIEYVDYELNEQIKLMIPNKKYGSIFSGGIDSSLQSAILKKYSDPHLFLNVNHENKDFINQNFKTFEKYLKAKISIQKINSTKYKNLSKKCFDVLQSPLFTHDLPSRMYLSEVFRKRNCKVFFSADGCDELLGGQQLYLKVFKNKNYTNNNSPYSSANFKSLFLKNYKTSHNYYKFLNDKWKKVFERYSFVKNLRERNILSSFFLDYFIQSIYVANKSTDLICCNSSVEPRNVFIQKKILKIFINLPFIYRINDHANKNFRQKYILKKIFIKYFGKEMIFPKEGFSGFPEILYREKHKMKDYVSNFGIINSNVKYYDRKNYKRDLSWKLSNIENFINRCCKFND